MTGGQGVDVGQGDWETGKRLPQTEDHGGG